MKNLITFLIFLPFLSFAQQTEEAKLDSLARLSMRYFNAGQPDSIYARMSDMSRAQMSAAQFSQVLKGLNAQVGKWNSIERRSIKGGEARYKANFDVTPIDFFISRDKEGKISNFIFKPYVGDVPDKTGPVPTSNPLKTAIDKKVDAIVQTYIKQANTVGLSMAVIRNDSLFSYGYGETLRGSGKIPDSSTLFEIGSISKTFTATLLADAIQRGLVKLDDPVNKYLPDSIPNLQMNGVAVTLKMLSNHTSGLPRLPTNLFTSQTDKANPYKHYDRSLLYSYLKTADLSRQPGTEYEYSNLATGLLGTILEVVNKKSYEQLLKQQITGPLGMTHTVIALNDDHKKLFAQGYDVAGNPSSAWDFQALLGAGGIRSTVSDLVLYLKAEMGKGPGDLVKAMQATQQSTFVSGSTNIGLGWHTNKGAAKPWFWHQGETGGFVAFVAFSPSSQTAVALLSNSTASIEELIGNIQAIVR